MWVSAVSDIDWGGGSRGVRQSPLGFSNYTRVRTEGNILLGNIEAVG